MVPAKTNSVEGFDSLTPVIEMNARIERCVGRPVEDEDSIQPNVITIERQRSCDRNVKPDESSLLFGAGPPSTSYQISKPFWILDLYDRSRNPY